MGIRALGLGIVAVAKEQIEKEHSQKLEDLELFVKENLL